MRLPKMLGHSVQNALLCRCVCYTINKNIVVIGEKYPPSFYCTTYSGVTWGLLGLRNDVGAGSSSFETGALA